MAAQGASNASGFAPVEQRSAWDAHSATTTNFSLRGSWCVTLVTSPQAAPAYVEFTFWFWPSRHSFQA
jgi:hypothetical protein